MKKLLDEGQQIRWWCPDCGQVRHKAQYEHQGQRFHAARCLTPMERAWVTVEAIR